MLQADEPRSLVNRIKMIAATINMSTISKKDNGKNPNRVKNMNNYNYSHEKGRKDSRK